MADDEKQTGRWTLYPPVTTPPRVLPDYLEKLMKDRGKSTLEALRDLAKGLEGSQLIRIEVDEFQLGLSFMSGAHISVYHRIDFGPKEASGASSSYCPNDTEKCRDFMDLVGKSVDDAHADDDLNLWLRFGEFGSLKILRGDDGFESYMMMGSTPDSWLVV